MKFTLATSAILLAGVASAVNVLEVRQNTIVVPDIGAEVSSRLGDAGDSINSRINEAGDRISEIGDRLDDKKSDIKDTIADATKEIGDVVNDIKTKGLTLVLPTLPTLTVDREAIKSAVSDLKNEINKLEPSWVDAMKNGETPAEVSEWLATAFPTNYASDVRAAISSEFPTFVRATGAGGDNEEGSKASQLGGGLMFALVSAAAGIVGLAIAL